MKRVAILISGGGSNMVSLVDDMTGDHPCRPVLVLSNVPEAGGLAKAAARGIETQVIDHTQFPKDRVAFEAALHATLLAASPDIVCLAGFMRILSPEFMAKWDGKMLNIHPSLLPKYRGLHTHQRAIDAGDAEHGCTVHEVTAELDGGPVLGQATVAISAGDTAETLAAKVLPFEHQLYPAVLRRYAQGDRTIVRLGT
ncbi:MAG: phosphoribosylglycinamide formyltransferase [Yoonia sp.]|jgi:phosphoribosylglycinamide formyltransferase 1|nr:phosphoribosylglycinamide formyltransferase [Yoonia sp.]